MRIQSHSLETGRAAGAFKAAFLALVAALFIGWPGLASAQAPEPRQTLNLERFMGRWHEILRTPNDHQRDCWAASQVWTRRAPNDFSIVQSCHRGPSMARVDSVKVEPAQGIVGESEFSQKPTV